MPIYECSKCIPTNIPDEMTEKQKRYIAFFVRASEPILVMYKLKEYLNLPLIEAKNIALHISRNSGYCHHCGGVLEKKEGNCLKCKRLNLDW